MESVLEWSCPHRVKLLSAHRRERLTEADTLHQFFRDIDDEEAWIKYVEQQNGVWSKRNPQNLSAHGAFGLDLFQSW